MADELALNDDTEEIRNAASILRVEFLDVFAAHPSHVKQARGQDLDGIALRLGRTLGSLSTEITATLRKAATDLGDAVNGWPTVDRFARALKDVPAAHRAAKREAPKGWRWRRGERPSEGVSASDWYIASLKQETAARAYLRDDIAGRSLAAFAHQEQWLCTLYWFVVDSGRLPSPDEEKRLIAQAAVADAVARASDQFFGKSVLALRQAMHDYAARQLGLEARQLAG